MAKIKNRLSKKHRNPIKARKQKLIDRINACKSLEEIKGWEKTFEYYPILCKDYDWDYGFFIDLIEFKLKRMAQYFHTHNIVVDEERGAKICDKAIAILNAGYGTNIILEKDLDDIYVNTRNVHRFFNPRQLDFISSNRLKSYYLPTVREVKAKALFWKFMHHYIEYLWD